MDSLRTLRNMARHTIHVEVSNVLGMAGTQLPVVELEWHRTALARMIGLVVRVG